jgi:hypothetical protein
MKVNLDELMVLERILLEIDVKHKFELDFGEAYKLYEYLKQVGKITSYAFLIQDEFHKKYDDTDKLKKYHDKIMESDIDFDYTEIKMFIENVLTKYGDDKIKMLVNTIKFW